MEEQINYNKDWESNYADLVKEVLMSGTYKTTRNGITRSLFGRTLKVNVPETGFPMLHRRKMYYKGVFGELSAMLAGAQSVAEFEKHGCNYWADWADKDGKLNIDYGRTWRDFNGVDQLAELIDTLKNDPNNRRMLISSWRPNMLKELSLPCCHLLYQWYVEPTQGGTYQLNMIWYQRSVDLMIGLPSDIIFAAAWNMLLAHQVGFVPGEITFMLGDCHVYGSHNDGAYEYIKRFTTKSSKDITRLKTFKPVEATIDSAASVDNFNKDSINLDGYEHLSPIKFNIVR